MSAPVSRSALFKDQLQLDGEAYAGTEDGYDTGSSARHVVAVGDSPASSVSGLQLIPETMEDADGRRLRGGGGGGDPAVEQPLNGCCRHLTTSRPRDATRGSFWVLRAASPDCTVQQ